MAEEVGKKRMLKTKNRGEFQKTEQLLFLLYLVAFFLIMMWRKTFFSFSFWAIFLFIFAVLIGRLKSFWADWGQFFILVCAYELLRGFADDLSSRVNIANVIAWEQNLFGFIPTLKYQELLFRGQVSWYDFLLALFYFTHFFFPLFFGMIFWLDSRKKFKVFINALLLLSFSAFITFLIFPTAPPWYAFEMNFLPPLEKIVSKVLSAPFLGRQGGFLSFYTRLNPNPVAAFPSLHAGYPFLIFLYLLDFYKKKSFWFLLIFLIISFALIYFGEHYVVDILGGIAFAFASFLIIKHFSPDARKPEFC